jgi:DNA repair protein RadC
VLLASGELLRRLTMNRLTDRPLLDQPAAVAGHVVVRYGGTGQEVLGVLYLDTRNQLIAEMDGFRGTLTRMAVDARPILREALRHHAASLLLYHIHPSGDPEPSRQDLRFTRTLNDAASLLGVHLLDHVVVGAGGKWESLRRRGSW